jgi:hypothetical protein
MTEIRCGAKIMPIWGSVVISIAMVAGHAQEARESHAAQSINTTIITNTDNMLPKHHPWTSELYLLLTRVQLSTSLHNPFTCAIHKRRES